MTVNVPLSVNLALKAHCSFPAEQGTETHYFDFATFERYRHAILGKNFVGPIFENYSSGLAAHPEERNMWAAIPTKSVRLSKVGFITSLPLGS